MQGASFWILSCLCAGIVTILGKSLPSSSDVDNDLKLIKTCNITSPIGLDALNTILINKKMSGVNNAEGFKCFLHCLYLKYNWMDEDGGFLIGNIKGVLEPLKLDELGIDFLVYKCSAQESSDRCERAFKFTECFWNENKKYPEEEERHHYKLDWK